MVVGFDKIGCMHMLRRDPLIVAFQEALPFDQVPEHPTLPKVLVIDNFFDLLLFFPIDQVWWRSGEVGPVIDGFLVGREEGRVKDIVDPPIVW
jgi:hypothetical protein